MWPTYDPIVLACACSRQMHFLFSPEGSIFFVVFCACAGGTVAAALAVWCCQRVTLKSAVEVSFLFSSFLLGLKAFHCWKLVELCSEVGICPQRAVGVQSQTCRLLRLDNMAGTAQPGEAPFCFPNVIWHDLNGPMTVSKKMEAHTLWQLFSRSVVVLQEEGVRQVCCLIQNLNSHLTEHWQVFRVALVRALCCRLLRIRAEREW